MIRIVMFLSLLLPVCAFGQVPPGVPYDAATHPNPILTYVSSSDFKPAEYAEAQEKADIELFGLSQRVGRRESIELATPAERNRRIRILGRNTDVTYYPVVRQTFALTDGGRLVLHSFKFPRTAIPADIAESVLNQAAVEKTRKPEDARFGLATPPERLDVRGNEALLFDDEDQLTLFWVEDGVVHTATADLPQAALMRVLRDLL